MTFMSFGTIKTASTEGRGGPGVASDGSKGGNRLDAVTPGLTLGTL